MYERRYSPLINYHPSNQPPPSCFVSNGAAGMKYKDAGVSFLSDVRFLKGKNVQ